LEGKEKKEEEEKKKGKELYDKIKDSKGLNVDEKQIIQDLLKSKYKIEDENLFDFFNYYQEISEEIKEKMDYKKPWLTLGFGRELELSIQMINSNDDEEYDDKIKILENCSELQNYLNLCKANNIEIIYNKKGYIVYE